MVSACTGVLFATLALRLGAGAASLSALVLCGVLVPVAVIDLRCRIIPNGIVLPPALVVYVTGVAAQPDRWFELLLGGLGAFLFLFVAGVIAPSGMGMGDVKLALVIGLALGRVTPVALFVACLPALLIIVRHRTRAMGLTIPFGPSLALGRRCGADVGAGAPPRLSLAHHVGAAAAVQAATGLRSSRC